MNLKPEEISSVIKEQIQRYSTKLDVSDVGTVIQKLYVAIVEDSELEPLSDIVDLGANDVVGFVEVE